MKEETIDARELYDKWSKRRNKIIENFRNGKISLKQRAMNMSLAPWNLKLHRIAPIIS
jgi:hypothetical protein